VRDAICVIVNPHAGGNGPADRGAEVRAALDAAGLDARIHPLPQGAAPDEAARAAIAAGARIVVAAGGDGTVSGVANALLQAGGDTRLGVLPFGTFNFFARGLGLPLDPAGAAAVLKAGAVREVRVGCVNGRVFLNNMSLGLYPSILETREAVYARWGRSRPAAYWSVLKSLSGAHRPMRLTLRTDAGEERVATTLAFVAASAYQLEDYNLDGADAVREGRLALFLARKRRATDLVQGALALAGGHARRGEEFALRTARAFEIDLPDTKVQVACDGERDRMETPLRVGFSADPIHVVAPAAS
jgi:diacylglycerol kinase family enzyme